VPADDAAQTQRAARAKQAAPRPNLKPDLQALFLSFTSNIDYDQATA
jgi:hypothetical protein